MTHCPWRGKPSTKQKQQTKDHSTSTPGHKVAIDQMKSPTAGLIAQMSGFIMKKQHRHATVFVDVVTGCGFACMQKTQSAEETLEAKKAFEKHSASHGVKVMNYHADNGTFMSRAWKNNCLSAHQGLTFTGVNAHHMDGHAEKRIRELQELARSMMIYAHQRWETGTTVNLWPCAL